MTRPNLDHSADHGWITWPGGACPVESDTIVRAQYACGHIGREIKAGILIWRRRGEPFDIVAYCRVGKIGGGE